MWWKNILILHPFHKSPGNNDIHEPSMVWTGEFSLLPHNCLNPLTGSLSLSQYYFLRRKKKSNWLLQAFCSAKEAILNISSSRPCHVRCISHRNARVTVTLLQEISAMGHWQDQCNHPSTNKYTLNKYKAKPHTLISKEETPLQASGWKICLKKQNKNNTLKEKLLPLFVTFPEYKVIFYGLGWKKSFALIIKN